MTNLKYLSSLLHFSVCDLISSTILSFDNRLLVHAALNHRLSRIIIFGNAWGCPRDSKEIARFSFLQRETRRGFDISKKIYLDFFAFRRVSQTLKGICLTTANAGWGQSQSKHQTTLFVSFRKWKSFCLMNFFISLFTASLSEVELQEIIKAKSSFTMLLHTLNVLLCLLFGSCWSLDARVMSRAFSLDHRFKKSVLTSLREDFQLLLLAMPQLVICYSTNCLWGFSFRAIPRNKWLWEA